MSRGCYKTYGRKVGPTTHASIQFDKLFRENSNKPCAAKSAGTVGKWGITSFTSIRSTHYTVGQGGGYGKRPRDKSKNNNVPAIAEVAPEAKPKKFFKSRNDEKPKPLPPAPPPPPPSLTKQYSRPPRSPPTRAPRSPAPPRSPSRPTRLASIVAARKLVDTLENENEEYEDDLFQTEAMNLSTPMVIQPPSPPEAAPSPSPSPPPEKEPSPPPQQHPPIVLRICKGTAQIITPPYLTGSEDEQQQPEGRVSKREGRRRSYGSDSNDSSSPPKKHKSKYRDYERREAEREKTEEEEMRSLQELKSVLEEDPLPTYPETSERLAESDCPVKLEDEEQEQLQTEPPQVYNCERMAVGEEMKEGEDDLKEEDIKEEERMEDGLDDPPTEDPLTEDPTTEDPLLDIKDESTSDSDLPGPEVVQETEVIQRVEPLVLRRPPGRPAKKASIFKSRGASGEKRNAHYIHKWSDQKEEGSKQELPAGLQTPLAGEFESETLTRVTNYSTKQEVTSEEEYEPITSVTCSKKAKEFYTVVRNVKKAHQIQESGEFQEFNDDVEYILDALQDNNPISTRCLSAITLASKCMVPAFRMHVRAHGTVTKFFRALHDATKDQRLGMCTATVMFVLSQDRLNMDIDRDSLELMLSLLESDASHSSALEGCGLSTAELKKTKDRVRSLCQEIQEQGHAKHLNLDNITVGQLAMETLLSLTSKRAGEWFKEELRDLGGLEHIIKTVVETCRSIDHTVADWTPPLLDKLRKADRCLRVLENVTLQNEENNNYLLTYGDGMLVDTVIRTLRICDSQIPFYPTHTLADKESVGAVIRECMIANLKVLINLTHDFNNKSFGSTLAGMREGLIESSLHILLDTPRYIPEEQKFDFNVLTLILLINLVEHCQANRRLLIEAKAPPRHDSMFAETGLNGYIREEVIYTSELGSTSDDSLETVSSQDGESDSLTTKPPQLNLESSFINLNTVDGGSAVSALVGMFLEQEELARKVERKTDAILDGEKAPEGTTEVSKSSEEFIEETVALLLQKAGRHMEHTLIGAYIALLLGYLIVENESFEEYVRSHMPNNNYEMLLQVLQKFYNFMMLTSSAGSGSSRGIKATELLIKQLTEIEKAISEGHVTNYSTS